MCRAFPDTETQLTSPAPNNDLWLIKSGVCIIVWHLTYVQVSCCY
jgi:hypothetical protein